MNHGTLRHLWPRPRGATTTTRFLSSSACCSAHFKSQGFLMLARKKPENKGQQGQYRRGETEFESLKRANVAGKLNRGLFAWAAKTGIEVEPSKMTALKTKGSKGTGIWVSYSRARHISEHHMKDMVLTTPLTVKYIADYEYRLKHPLWLAHHASHNYRNVVRTTAMRKARRALLAALKRNHYLPNGKAFADDLVRGTEVFGTIKTFINEPLKVLQTPMAELATYFNTLLSRDMLPAMRRRVIKDLPVRESPALRPAGVVKPVSSAGRAMPRGLGYARRGDSLGPRGLDM